MARRSTGRDISGWLLLDKPAGVTSTAAVGRARWALGARKAGHAGTLDPAATGLLAIALGEATKTIPFVTDALKAYRFTVRWGAETTTDDAEGEVLRRTDARPDAAAIEAALPAFRGDILQTPPAFSAVKVAGARAYDLAREGQAPDLSARPLHVARLDLVERPDPDRAVLEMVCGKGGYVRAIARDLGRALGCLGHVESLRRLWSGPFTVASALEWDELAPGTGIEDRLLPLEAALAGLPECRCAPGAEAALRHGRPGAVIPPRPLLWGEEAWASAGGRAVAIGTWEGGHLRPSRVLASTGA
ncbi:tRNA pseudouridine(55) synthase TruB [Rubellimicrobium sp. CFH 75288]|uniref:tRNA pseudouridine(55) synthase TruB n=1 Tax=Rubellimicrobium sp. CFH 75288 TaxID=2697034 RepID=UPI0014135C1C|nr:tRNA pseudouridine(55) synthase TruB [Rubellimicrobium sp. CFH 75288]NAZ37247.1 tRNA pseudouridine(55) synthase TruB [Rubellimicrobium sp. CFH 75288]